MLVLCSLSNVAVLGCTDKRKENLTCPGPAWKPFDVKVEKGPSLTFKLDAPGCLLASGTWSSSGDDVGIPVTGDSKDLPMRGLRRWAGIYKLEMPATCVDSVLIDGKPAGANAAKKYAAIPNAPLCIDASACKEPVSLLLKVNDDFNEDNMNTGALCAAFLPESEAKAWSDKKTQN
jgi:hypothetical protein